MENKRFMNMALTMLKLEKQAHKFIKKQKIEKKEKAKNDMITNWDLGIEKFLLEKLQKQFPDVKVLSEEFNTNAEVEGTFFVIDPVDGTINFSCGIRDGWATQMAYVENGEVAASALLFENGDMLYAAAGCGTYWNGKKITVPPLTLERSIFTLPERDRQKYDDAIEIGKHALHFRFEGASCVDFKRLVLGQYGMNVCLKGFHLWDIYPGLLCATEAGCVYDYCLDYFIVANNAEMLKQVKSVLNKARKGRKDSVSKA